MPELSYIQIATELNAIAGRVSDKSISGGSVAFGDDPTLHISMADNKLLEQLVDDLYEKKQWSRHFSRECIDEALLMLLIKKFKHQSDFDLPQQFEEYRKDFNGYAEKVVVVVPLHGLRLGKTITHLDVAGVRLIRYRDTDFYKHWSTVPTEGDDPLKSRPSLGGQVVCATCEVTAEPIRAGEMATQNTQVALNLLRYTIGFSEFEENQYLLDVFAGEPRGVNYSYMVVDAQYARIGSYERVELRGHLKDMTLGAAWLKQANKSKFAELSDYYNTVSPSQKNSVKAQLMQAVYWFGSYQIQKNLDFQLLCLTTCVESIFKTDKGDNVSTMLSEGIALMISKKSSERKEIRDRFKQLYDLRSKITHGTVATVTRTHVKDMEHYARRLIIAMVTWLSSNSDSQEDFRKYINDLKLD